MTTFFELLLRGFSLRCPVCGKGKLFRSPMTMYENCPVCHFHYEREVGYFSSAMAIDLVVSEFIVAAIAVPLASNLNVPLIPLLLWGAPLPFILPILFYWHSRSLWMSMDHFMNPTMGNGSPDQPLANQQEPQQKG